MDERVFASLGILKVAAVLEQKGYGVDHLDLSGVTNCEDVVKDYVKQDGARVFGITATTPQMPAATKVAHALHESKAKVILGGPHPTLVKAALRTNPENQRAQNAWDSLTRNFDVLVSGDGEKAIFQAIESDSPVVDADDTKGPLWLTSQDFQESPWPARHLIDLSTYHYQIDGVGACSAIGQLGCPFRCTFCAGRDSNMLRRVRLRQPENVISEMLHIHEVYGLRGCMFLDDELNVNKQMLPLMRGLKDTGIDWRFRGFLKAELFTEEQAEAMYQAGFRQLLIGFESGHDRILTNIQKNATRADNTKAMSIARKHGLKVKALMSLGHAGESEETIQATRDWLLEVNPSDFDATIITPYPGSPYYDYATTNDGLTWCYTAKSGDKLYMTDVNFSEQAQFYKGMPGSYVSYVWTDHLTRERLVELRDWLETDVRKRLGIPFYQSGTAERYEASMGQTKLPRHILRSANA
jgi:anaerobic magnesium-protoporphyrin IX monomethyl ester cyclase